MNLCFAFTRVSICSPSCSQGDEEAGEEAELKAAFDDCDKDGNKQVHECVAIVQSACIGTPDLWI